MKLEAHQLDAHLNAIIKSDGKTLPPCYLIVGDESLLCIESADAIRSAANNAGYTNREIFTLERGLNPGLILQAFASNSLFGDRSLIELRLPTTAPNKEFISILLQIAQWLSQEKTDAIAMISMPALSSKAKPAEWFSILEKTGILVNCPSITPKSLPRWIEQRAINKCLKLAPGAAQWLADHLEGNLLAAKQEIEKLALLYSEQQTIDLSVLQASVSNMARYNVFNLGQEALSAKADYTLRMIKGLQAEGQAPTLVLWALAEEVRNLHTIRQLLDQGHSASSAIKETKVWGPKADILSRAVQRFSEKNLHSLLRLSAHADKAIKGLVHEDPWHILRILAMALAGVHSPLDHNLTP